MKKKLLALLLALSLLFSTAFAEILVEDGVVLWDQVVDGEEVLCTVEYGEVYSDPESVAMYLHVFCELPGNFITKKEAANLGWDSYQGNLWDVAYGMSIGGDRFGNREGILPDAKGRKWYEADLNYEGGYRGKDRLLFSDDGLIYVSYDHYTTAEMLYDEWFEEGYYAQGNP